MRIQITKDAKDSYQIGINEIVGLKDAMLKIMTPVQVAIKENVYWADVDLKESEYKPRAGFIPYSSNCGGIELIEIIPQSESDSFSYLKFGEWDGTHYCDEKDTDNCECPYDTEGEYDAKLRVWLKFEGIDQDSKRLKFYLYMGGGNSDAPYFRTNAEATIFEREFECASVAGFIRAAHPHVKALIKIIKKG
jgi:hypothetical protein